MRKGTPVGAPISSTTPRVWLLLGHKAGDNNQVLALAERLAWPRVEKRIVYRSWELLTNRLLGATLAGIDRTASTPLVPPWPELVITSGRRNEPVARWIRKQTGGVLRIVHIGRPWAPLGSFDLIVSTPQYLLPQRSNIVVNELPLHRLNTYGLEEAAARWRPEFSQLPSPRTTVLLGGNSGAFIFSAAKARQMGQLVNGLVRSQKGSVLVSDSARTPAAAMDMFLKQIEVPVYCHRWAAGQRANPYLGMLALADQFVITGDSMSMIAEACFTAKPLYLFSLDDGPDWWKRSHNYRFKPLTHRLAMAFGPRRMRRDVNGILAGLIANKRAAWLGDASVQAAPGGDEDEAMRTALRVAGLFTPLLHR